MYRVLRKFKDLLDNNYIYEMGEEYPRSGYSPSSERIAELSCKNNKIGKELIIEIPATNSKKDLEEDTKKEVKEETDFKPILEEESKKVGRTRGRRKKALKSAENEFKSEDKPKRTRKSRKE